MDPVIFAINFGIGALGGLLTSSIGWSQSQDEKFNSKKFMKTVVFYTIVGVATTLLAEDYVGALSVAIAAMLAQAAKSMPIYQQIGIVKAKK